jgi:uncharacterized protein YbjT (DUF2867 family)
MSQEKLILVIGSSGKTGRRVVERLQDRGAAVRGVSRSTEPSFDWYDQQTWPAALDGVQSAYITFQPDLAVPGSADIIQAFTDLTLSSGVQRLVLLSGRGEDEALLCEQVVQRSGVEWTIIRASWFNQNFHEGFLLDTLLSGEVMLPVTDVQEPFVDVDDIADIAAAALTEDRHVGQVYEVTGPRLMTFQQVVDEIAAAAGRELRFTSVLPDEYVAALREAQVPEDYIWLISYLFTTVLDGRNSSVTPDVERALGRPPRDFSDYVRETAATGIWNTVPNEAGMGSVL